MKENHRTRSSERSKPARNQPMASPREYSLARASNLSREHVSQLAEGFAKSIGYKPGGDIIKAVENLGGQVAAKEYWVDKGNDGSLIVHDKSNFDIFVPRHTSDTRDRFTIAHELGHYILHYLLPKFLDEDTPPMYANRYGSNREEWEANWFAASFLMPEKEFAKSFRKHAGAIALVGNEFGVSPRAAEIRGRALGLLDGPGR